MSEVLLDFLEPYLKDNEPDRAHTSMVGMGALVWNLAFFPEAEREETLTAAAHDLTRGDPEARPTLELAMRALLHRRLTLFGENRRMILKYAVSRKAGGLYLDVVSSLPNPQDDSS
ncbi:MAG: hypothetical protein HY900_13455 [Deltaproteobacteria bacterium]|nr:hypothetical protein [Deltaproteobacteria bacterium]